METVVLLELYSGDTRSLGSGLYRSYDSHVPSAHLPSTRFLGLSSPNNGRKRYYLGRV